LEERLEKVEEIAKQVLKKYGELIKCIVTVGSTAREGFKPELLYWMILHL